MSRISPEKIIDFAPSDPELVGKARGLYDLLRKNAPLTDSSSRCPQENIDALEMAGIFKTQRPRRFGGHQASIRTTLEVSAEIGRACGGTAWVVTLGNVGDWIASLLSDKFQDEFFGSSPNARSSGALTPSVRARKVEGGYVLNGEWHYCSGSLHASYAGGTVMLEDENGNDIGPAITMIPMNQVELKETWFVIGMRGSGSNSIYVKDLFVPEYKFMPVIPAIEGNYSTVKNQSEPLYRAAFVPVFAVVLVGPFLGLARAALESFLEKLPNRAIAYTNYKKQIEAPNTHFQLARAAMLIDGAHMHAFRAAHDVDHAALIGEYPDATRRARIRMDCAQAVYQCKAAVNLIVETAGSSAMAENNPLQRIWRDTNTAASHAIVDHNINLELYGRMLLDQPGITHLI